MSAAGRWEVSRDYGTGGQRVSCWARDGRTHGSGGSQHLGPWTSPASHPAGTDPGRDWKVNTGLRHVRERADRGRPTVGAVLRKSCPREQLTAGGGGRSYSPSLLSHVTGTSRHQLASRHGRQSGEESTKIRISTLTPITQLIKTNLIEISLMVSYKKYRCIYKFVYTKKLGVNKKRCPCCKVKETVVN